MSETESAKEQYGRERDRMKFTKEREERKREEGVRERREREREEGKRERDVHT